MMVRIRHQTGGLFCFTGVAVSLHAAAPQVELLASKTNATARRIEARIISDCAPVTVQWEHQPIRTTNFIALPGHTNHFLPLGTHWVRGGAFRLRATNAHGSTVSEAVVIRSRPRLLGAAPGLVE
jgi:hypothetical protein